MLASGLHAMMGFFLWCFRDARRLCPVSFRRHLRLPWWARGAGSGGSSVNKYIAITPMSDPRPSHPALRDVQLIPGGYTARFKHLFFRVTSWKFEANPWVHLSVSRRDKQTPTYADLVALKHYCIGTETIAYQILPPASAHIDFSKQIGFDVLHLWAPIDHTPLPDFGRFGSI